jgi:hypothetical protein
MTTHGRVTHCDRRKSGHKHSAVPAEYAQPVDDELVVAERDRTFSSGLRQVPNVMGSACPLAIKQADASKLTRVARRRVRRSCCQ